MKLFYNLPRTIGSLYKGKNLIWQVVAAALTYIIVASGFDWRYFESTRGLPFGILLPAIALGGILPIILPLVILFFGALRKSARTIVAGWAIGQAALLGFLVSSFYKAFTGRVPPSEGFRGIGRVASTATTTAQSALAALSDTSHGFQFGFLRGGVFWGWPSSHTTVAFAMGAAVFALFPRHKWLRWLGFLWSLYVGIAVSVSIHWFSEFVAGAIIGTVIGIVVGKAFRAVA